MKTLHGGSKAGSMDKIHQASITITLFTLISLIFLICNIPYFFNEVIHTISVHMALHHEYPPGKSHDFLHPYVNPNLQQLGLDES